MIYFPSPWFLGQSLPIRASEEDPFTYRRETFQCFYKLHVLPPLWSGRQLSVPKIAIETEHNMCRSTGTHSVIYETRKQKSRNTVCPLIDWRILGRSRLYGREFPQLPIKSPQTLIFHTMQRIFLLNVGYKLISHWLKRGIRSYSFSVRIWFSWGVFPVSSEGPPFFLLRSVGRLNRVTNLPTVYTDGLPGSRHPSPYDRENPSRVTLISLQNYCHPPLS